MRSCCSLVGRLSNKAVAWAFPITQESLFLAEDVAVCAEIQRRNATSYGLATKLFPRREREATQVLYAFVRIADDLVDQPADGNPEAVRKTLDAWSSAWEAAYAGTPSRHPVLRSAARLFRHYEIPKEYADAFLASMRRDIDCHGYQTYASLMRDYVYGSAAVVGLCMCRICGVSDAASLQQAQCLGEAMQLTNFLRDIREDACDRQRLYLAEEDLRHFGVTTDDIRAQRVTPAFVALLQEYIRRARSLYKQSEPGIAQLPAYARPGVQLSKVLYERILSSIERLQYDVFRNRARTNDLKKLLLAGRVLLTGS